MRYLLFTNTPAHVHLYRNLVGELEAAGHDVLVLGRDYSCTRALLEYYDLPFELYGRQGTDVRSLLRNAPGQFYGILRKARAYDPDVIFGRGAYAVFAGLVTGQQPILVLDSEPSDLAHQISSRFARAVFTPSAFKSTLGSHHYQFDGLKECAYLHPDVCSPDPAVRDRLGLAADERYAIVRFNAFDALHDVGASGETKQRRNRLLSELSEKLTVFVSDEGGELDFGATDAQPYDLHPGLIHDALAGADLLVADTGTMVTEAALLGTPAVRFVDASEPSMGEFEELAANGLVAQHSTFEAVLAECRDLLADESAVEDWAARRAEYFESRPNLTDILYEIATRPRDPADVSQSSSSVRPASPN